MTPQNAICINIQVDSPYLTVMEFARRNGVTERSVRDLVQQGRLPIRKRKSEKEKIYINMIALMKEALEQQ